MKACTTASGGVIFIPEKLERKAVKLGNDNKRPNKKPLTSKKP